MTNRKRGLIRLAVVIAVSWCLFWTVVGLFGDAKAEASLADLRRFEALHEAAGTAQGDNYWFQVTAHMERVNAGSEQVATAVRWGIGIPLALLIILPVAWWIYRGFKPRGVSK